jgi:hypothetical protein
LTLGRQRRKFRRSFLYKGIGRLDIQQPGERMTPDNFSRREFLGIGAAVASGSLAAAFDLDVERDRLGSRLTREVGVLAKAS